MPGLGTAASIDDIRLIARRRLPRAIFDFLDGGAECETAVTRNRAAFGRWALLPRYLRDVSAVDTSCELFGRRWSLPFGIAPTGLSSLFWPGADVARARTAAALNIPFVLSTASSEPIEAVAEVAREQTWFQLYAMKDWSIVVDLLRRAADAGIGVAVVTVDTPISARRERDIRHGLDVPLRLSPSLALDVLCHPRWSMTMLRQGRPRFGNLTGYRALTQNGCLSAAAFVAARNGDAFGWRDFDRLRGLWAGKLVIKGLMAPADVALAAEHGADGIILSNHGGRQLDAALAPIEVLSAAVAVADGRLEIMLDSGIRRGSDVIKAIGLGACFTFIGRAPLYGLAAGGPEGMALVFDILQDELRRTMAQIGCTSLADVSAGRVVAANPLGWQA